ncbi:serine protein kinase [Myxococcota bacterium]|jgi:serine protein kinase|nr:serine protein kinase [Myxococcota bacterium]MBU1410714.1 serine protein kinase [Myxococcota bacterium]MBU1510769.1 serine protein kinase [Myxococcota bacterium]PKN27784.1 MAG: serine protein kinase [Deltaproteobacteria bacterium HGW-Deltaproteobacteria-22]
MSEKSYQNVSEIARLQNQELYRAISWTGSFQDYLNLAHQEPDVLRTAYQRMFDMIISHGTDVYTDQKKEITRYLFFYDLPNQGREAVFGLDIPLMRLVNIFKGAACGYGPERRIILLHGPVGSAKSSIVRLIKRGLEDYSRTDRGKLYTFNWILPPEMVRISGGETTFPNPMNQDPILLVPPEWRRQVVTDLIGEDRFRYPIESLTLDYDLDPASRLIYNELLRHYNGDWEKVVSNHVQVRRLVLSEKDRVGIGTFQPKDEKNQDSTELTGDLNYRKIAEYGSDSDPRAFNFDGEFNIANRGIVEFIEMLKLDVAFLYDLLGATQEHKIKPKKFAQTDIDEVIIGHTNEAEYKKLLGNEFMEALRDRTIKVDIPYITRVSEEQKIYAKNFHAGRIKKHIAPHTLEMASMWSVLTRLQPPTNQNISLIQKMKLYDGKLISGYTVDTIKELRKNSEGEAMTGISPRYVQDKLSAVLVSEEVSGCINPFMVMNELEKGLRNHTLITSEEQRENYREILALVKEEYENVVKHELQRVISADEESITRLCAKYIDNVKAYTLKESIRDKYSGNRMDPDEKLMRSIEEKIDVPENRKDDFRSELMNFIGALALEHKQFDYKQNERLLRALELKLFEDSRDTLKFSTLGGAGVLDKEDQGKLDVIRKRLITEYHYCEDCASDILHYATSIFARGDTKIP